MELDMHEFSDEELDCGGKDYTKWIFGGCALLGMMAVGAILANFISSASAVSTPTGPPAVPLYVQAQQAAIEAMHAQQQMVTEMRMRMAEAEGDYYGDGYGQGGYDDGYDRNDW